MRRLSIGAKLWITTGILALPLIGSSVFYVQSLTDTLWFTQKEQRGQALFAPLDALIRDVTAFEVASARAGDAIEADLQSLLRTDYELGTSATHSQVEDIRVKWTALRESRGTGADYAKFVNPIQGTDGERMGTVVEWRERTREIQMEQELQIFLSEIINGDLTQRMNPGADDGFFAVIARSVNQLAETMSQMVATVKSASQDVHRGSVEISQGNADLSSRTEQQSSSLEQTAASMEQTTSTVKQNADNASQANQLASAARDQAEKGGAVTGKAIRAMSEINGASRKIAAIIGVIDEIAFLTNLRALNAAVEAARAGEQGRGFAVVATEVRNLAGRSASVAKQVKELIEDSVQKADSGSLLVTESGHTRADCGVGEEGIGHRSRDRGRPRTSSLRGSSR